MMNENDVPDFSGTLRGSVRSVSDPDAEPVPILARRTGFAGAELAMDWCRRVLDGTQMPPWTHRAPLPEHHTAPEWEAAFVNWDNPPRPGGISDEAWDELRDNDSYWTADVDDRGWYAIGDGWGPDLVRTDPAPS